MFSGDLVTALQTLQPLVFGALIIAVVIRWRRHPGPATWWLCVAFGALALFFVAEYWVSAIVAEYWLPENHGDPAMRWASRASIAVLVVFPYALYRFMWSFVRPSRWFKSAAAVLTGAVGGVAFALPNSSQGEPRGWVRIWVAAFLLQWILLSATVAVRLWRAGRNQPAVSRRRMRTMSIATAGLALAAVLEGGFPTGGETALLVQLLALSAAPLMLIGFGPPYLLRVAWRRREESALEEARLLLMRATTVDEVVETLLTHARALVGATIATFEHETGRAVASKESDREDERLASKRTPSPSPVTIPMGSGRLTVVTSPFAPFFGRDEITRLEELAALADLALARNRLLDSRRRLADIVESNEDAIIGKTLDGIITSWNRGAENIYGYRAEEALGRPMSIVVPANAESDVAKIMDKIRQGRYIRRYKTKALTKDGRTIDVSMTISPLRDAAGAVVGASTISRDITDATRLRTELEEQAELLNIAQDAIMARTIDGTIDYWNRAAEETYGWSKEDAVGKESHALLQTRFPVPLDEIQSELMSRGRWEGELVQQTRTGSEVVVQSRWALRRDPQGEPLQVLEVNDDVTARKRVEEEAARQRELLSAIFDTSPDVIATITSDLELVYANPAAREILGYELDELFSDDSRDRVHPDDLGVAAELLQVAFGAGSTGEGRLRVKTADDKWIWLDIRIRRMERAPNTAVVVARDVTEQVRLEERLTEAKEAADDANRAKSTFLSRMSHELRTPLNAVLGFAQLLDMEPLTDEQKEGVTEILEAGRHLLELIDEVLDIARIEAGRARLSLEPVDAVEAAQECISLLTPLADQEGVTLFLEGHASSHCRLVTADRQRIKQVLVNLISNGIKYNSAPGSVRVSFPTTGNAGRVRIDVTDTGPGIPGDQIEHAFAPFERLGSERSRVEGAGLGLTLTKTLVDAMGGTISVSSEPGQGSTFSVDLVDVSGTNSEGVAGREDEAMAGPTKSTVRTILYIEDNVSNLKLVERLVARRPRTTLMTALEGGVGITLARDHRPDLILLDLDLPDMPGETVLARLLADPLTAKVPVVVLSANAMPGQMTKLLDAGARAYLTKPLDVGRFFQIVDGFDTEL